jgi:hypothetical protein
MGKFLLTGAGVRENIRKAWKDKTDRTKIERPDMMLGKGILNNSTLKMVL